MNYEQIKAIAECCITERPLSTSGSLNVINLAYKANWDYPVWGNIITGQNNMAMAFIHDDAIDADGKLIGPIKFAIECRADEVVYHPLYTLIKEEIIRPPQKLEPPRRNAAAHPCLELKDKNGSIHRIEYRQYKLNDHQQFAVLAFDSDDLPVAFDEVPGVEYDMIGKLGDQSFIFSRQIINSLEIDHWDFENYPNPEIVLITSKRHAPLFHE